MGGNALKTTVTRRYDAGEYHALCEQVMYLAGWYGKNNRAIYRNIVPAYHTKESFGDMDIVYCTYDDVPYSIQEAKSMFTNTKEIVRNTNVISLEHKEFQIDLIHVRKNVCDYALKYFAFNDAGNLVGKIARRFGLKHGHNGLTLPIRDGNNLIDEILITNDFDAALKFLDLDAEQFNIGFDTLDDIFTWVTNSKYFNPDAYQLENLSHIGRVRDKKRTTYQAFLTWIADRQYNVIPFSENKMEYLETIFKSFPDAFDRYDAVMRAVATTRYLKTKFNGSKVSAITGLTGAQLGKFMQYLSTQFLFNSATIIHMSETDITNAVNNALVNFNDTI